MNNIFTRILNAPRTFVRNAKSAIGALQQPAQKLSPARSAKIPTATTTSKTSYNFTEKKMRNK